MKTRALLLALMVMAAAPAVAQEWIRITKPLPEVSDFLRPGQEFPVRQSAGSGESRILTIEFRGKVLSVNASDVDLLLADDVAELSTLKGEVDLLIKKRAGIMDEITELIAKRRELEAQIKEKEAVLEGLGVQAEQRGSPATWVSKARPEEMQQFALMGRLRQEAIKDLLNRRTKMTADKFGRLGSAERELISSYGPLWRAYSGLARASAQEQIGQFVEEVDPQAQMAAALLAFLRGKDGRAAGILSAEPAKQDADELQLTVSDAWISLPVEARDRVLSLVRLVWILTGDNRSVTVIDDGGAGK